MPIEGIDILKPGDDEPETPPEQNDDKKEVDTKYNGRSRVIPFDGS